MYLPAFQTNQSSRIINLRMVLIMSELTSVGTSYFFEWITQYQMEGPYELMKCFITFLSPNVHLLLVTVKATGELLCNCSVNYIVFLSRNSFLTFALSVLQGNHSSLNCDQAALCFFFILIYLFPDFSFPQEIEWSFYCNTHILIHTYQREGISCSPMQ